MATRRIYEFGEFQLDPAQRRIEKQGETVTLHAKAFDALVYLVEHAGEPVSRRALTEALWPKRVVEENNLTQAISALRRALGEACIVTLAGRGYQFVVEVRTVAVNPSGEPATTSERPRSDVELPPVTAAPADPATRSGAVSNTEASGSVAGKSVAVLPFADLSEGGDLLWLADGLAAEILNSLGRVPELKVTARTSSFQFRNQSRDIGELAARLGVANVLEGSVRVSGDQLRVTAQLIRAVDGFHVWSNVYGGSTSSLFDFERDVAESVAAALDVVLDESRRARMFASGTQNVEAFKAYQDGWSLYNVVHWAPSDQTLWDANTHFERAMALDPRYAQAAIGRTDAFGHLLATPRLPLVRNSPYSQEEALTQLHQTLDFIAANGSTATMRLGAQIFRENFSPTWHRMPRLFAQLRQQWDVNSILVGGGVDSALWLPHILLLASQTDLVRALAESHVINDPLSTEAWFRRVLVEIHGRDFDSARELLAQARRNLGASSLESLELTIARFEGDRAAAMQILTREPPSQLSCMHMASISGDYPTAMRIADELEKRFEDPPGVDWAALLLVYHETGEAERARFLVKRIDESLAGTAIFVWLISDYGNGLYFDLNDAPNFVAKLKQARIDPASFSPVPRLSTVQLQKYSG